MKTPISYYGGKQQLVAKILPLIPEHRTYTEAFCGGGAIFFSKEPSAVEIINDTNQEVINFYKVLKTQFKELSNSIQTTLHSRKMYENAKVIYDHAELFDPVQRATAFYILTNQGWGSKVGSWGYDIKKNQTSKKYTNKKFQRNKELAARLDYTQVECTDALRVVNSRDTHDTFHYVDPPYPKTDQGHYNGYTVQDFTRLLEVLSKIKGKFLLSSFPLDILDKYIELNGWYKIDISMNKSISKGRKVEVLTANYPIALKKAA
ncbi:MAG: DNA adenine methylase [Bacteroidales bacterium]|nr:DNA adenine methylase [Bacteroidales bacterium]